MTEKESPVNKSSQEESAEQAFATARKKREEDKRNDSSDDAVKGNAWRINQQPPNTQ